MTLDLWTVLIALMVSGGLLASWRGLFRDPVYAHEPAWIRWAFLAVESALFLFAGLYLAVGRT